MYAIDIQIIKQRISIVNTKHIERQRLHAKAGRCTAMHGVLFQLSKHRMLVQKQGTQIISASMRRFIKPIYINHVLVLSLSIE